LLGLGFPGQSTKSYITISSHSVSRICVETYVALVTVHGQLVIVKVVAEVTV
jgi:hypothetical protein